jgi:FMN phosphatase YigB (HAD superfamily)
VNIVFDVSGTLYPLDEQAATVTGESLRRKAAGQLGDEGVEGARDIADEIERILVGTSSEPIQLARERADAVFYVLNVSVRPNNPEDADALALYVAVREIHDERLRRG